MKEFLSGVVGESTANIIGFLLIFAIILIGIFVIVTVIRRLSGGKFTSNKRTRQPRLSVMDAAAVDSRRRLVLIRRDDVEHLLLIGGPTDVVVEQNIVMESRANARVQATRIEAEHIERFRQHEAAIGNDLNERPALPTQSVAEKHEALEVNSAIEPSFSLKEKAPTAQITEPAVAPPAPPQPPITQTVTPTVTQAARPASQQPGPVPATKTVLQKPQARPTTNYPPQPRTVLPSQSSQTQQPSARLHPAYPLGQVSRGVLSSTSNTTAQTTATLASVGGELGKIVPETSESSIAATSDTTSVSLSDNGSHSFGTANAAPHFTTSTEPKRVEPEVSFATPEVKKDHGLEAATSEDDGLVDLSGALHDAIMSDLEADKASRNEVPSATESDLTSDFFEKELLSSLDISAKDEKPSNTIEDEMEKLLGELSIKETRS